ncbi:MAG: metallophosphoesterase family protein [Clostridia bacterium]|nr:metallophosphoesterase family protein [Clostridia bacterium]
MKYYISDLHFFHDNIIRFENRPFNDMYDMITSMIERWNETVTPEDEVYVLGDVFFKAKDSRQCVAIMQALNGTKHCIRGNHDKALRNENIAAQFADIKELDMVKDNGRMIMLCHYPMESWCARSHGTYMLYGHIHTHWGSISRALPNRYNVCCEVLNYRPHTLDELIVDDMDYRNKPGSPRWSAEDFRKEEGKK